MHAYIVLGVRINNAALLLDSGVCFTENECA